MEQQQGRIKLFYSNDPSDDMLCDKLVRFLRPLVRETHIDEWSTQHVLAGANVVEERKHALDSATHILLLLSADYLASDLCHREMQDALERQKRGQARVIPILLRPCLLSEDLGSCLPKNGQPVSTWAKLDQALSDVAQNICQILGLPYDSIHRGHLLNQLFTSLTDGLIGLPGSPLTSVEQFLQEYLGTPEAPTPFGGRHVELASLDRWLATPGQPYALLVAPAGRGKSALLARWIAAVADERRAEVVLVPISIRFGTSHKSTTVSLLGARLRHLYPMSADWPHNADGWLAEIDRCLRKDHPLDSPLLIILDGADEAVGWMMGQDLRFPPEPGRGIKVLVSARALADRDTAGWMRHLKWQRVGVPLNLPLLDRLGIAEVLRSMGDPLARLMTQVDLVGELHRLSEGDPLLVRLYVEALYRIGERAAFLTSEDLRHLKPGLEAYFDQWWDDQRRQWGTFTLQKEPNVRTLLNLMACALGPLSTNDLLALTEPERFDLWILEEALQPLGRFVVGNGKEQSYVFSHSRLSQYFYEKLPARERQMWEQRFTRYGRETLVALTRSKLAPGDSSYAIRYYGAHLEREDAPPDRFDELVCEGWQRAWEALEGTYDGFLSDLMRAWKRAEESGAQAQSVQERGRAIAQQCRYALIVTSIKNLASNTPPALLSALLDTGVWTPIQGLASARQIPDEESRTWALARLAPYLSEPLQVAVLQEALAAARSIASEFSRARALAGLAPYLREPLLQEALAVARSIANEFSRAWALVPLVSRLGELGQEKEALTVAHSIAGYQQAKALAELAPYLSGSAQQEVLAAARTIDGQSGQSKVLAALAPHLSEPLQHSVQQEALDVARSIADESGRAWALAGLAPHLSEPLRGTVLQEAFAATRSIADESGRAEALMQLNSYLSEPLQQEALAFVSSFTEELHRAEALAGLAPYLSEPLLQEALVAARSITNERQRAEALVPLVSRLGELGQEKEALAVARSFAGEFHRAEALAGLAPYLSEPLLQEALDAARSFADGSRRAEALAGLAPYLSEPLQNTVLQEALAVTRLILDWTWRAWALAGLIPRLGELGQEKEALVAARSFTEELHRAKALAGLAPYLSEPLLQEALAASRSIANESYRAEALAGLAPYLSEPLLQEALAASRSIVNEPYRAKALVGLIPRLGELGQKKEALDSARSILYGSYRAEALAGLAPHLSEPLQSTVLQEALAACSFADEQRRADALEALAPHLPEPLLQEALAAARSIADEQWRAKALAGLVPRLGELGEEKKALDSARSIADQSRRTKALARLAPHLSEPLQSTVLQEALAAARTLAKLPDRAEALAELALYMKRLPIAKLYSLWCETLPILAVRDRTDLLSDIQALIPIIVVLGGKEVLGATIQAIIEVGDWFP